MTVAHSNGGFDAENGAEMWKLWSFRAVGEYF